LKLQSLNGWLHGDDLAGYPGDDRKFLVRLFQAGGDGVGVARAVLSDKYKVADLTRSWDYPDGWAGVSRSRW
jgi:hypothetical protein